MEFVKSHWFLLTMLALATIVSFVWLFVFNRKKTNSKWWECLIVTVLYCIFGVIAAIVFSFFESGMNGKFVWGGTSLYGAVFFTPIFCIIYALIKKMPFKQAFDLFAPIIAAYLALARINCLYSGCCYGILLDAEKGIRWPAREADILFQVLFIIFVSPKVIEGKTKGLALPLFFVSYGVFRFINEWLRYSETTRVLHDGHIWSICAFVIGGTWIALSILLSKKKGASNEE